MFSSLLKKILLISLLDDNELTSFRFPLNTIAYADIEQEQQPQTTSVVPKLTASDVLQSGDFL